MGMWQVLLSAVRPSKVYETPSCIERAQSAAWGALRWVIAWFRRPAEQPGSADSRFVASSLFTTTAVQKWMALRSHSLLIKSPCIFSATADFVFQALINRAPSPAAGAGVREPISRRAVPAPSAAAGVGPVGGAAPPQAAGRRRRVLLV